jgi:hypothetical protein
LCTSFATYFDEPIYAMNIDHPDRERKFKITTLKRNWKNDTIIRFHCQNKENERFLDSVCMNSLGMFSNYQFLVPNKNEQIPKPKSNIIADGNLFSQSQMYVETVDELLKRMCNRTVYYSNSFGSFKLHNMYADKDGGAIIIEASENGNAISSLQDKFIVMTNFPVYEFEGKHYSEVYGDGSDRYKIAYDEIIKSRNKFGIEQAFEVLKKTKFTSEYFPTVCSMVFDPAGLYVYLVLFGIFEKIWRISITENIIESYAGFEETYKFKISKKGILASELEKYM